MNELEFGAPLPVGMAAVLKQRLTPRQLADTMLTAKRWTAPEALKVSHGELYAPTQPSTSQDFC